MPADVKACHLLAGRNPQDSSFLQRKEQESSLPTYPSGYCQDANQLGCKQMAIAAWIECAIAITTPVTSAIALDNILLECMQQKQMVFECPSTKTSKQATQLQEEPE
uniref:Uncharacterized protein n=1 Tax=Dunaliella tertiolecta TaxID=3047 RepID=A0A7S3QUL1_DUNTE